MIKKIAGKDTESILALTPMQQGLLFHYLEDPRGESYFNQLDLEVSGEIEPGCFEKTWNVVIDTNEILRTVFRWEKLEKPVQVVLKTHALHLQYRDLTTVGNREEQNSQWETIKQQDRDRQFDLRRVPFRVILGKMTENHYHILISNHHILYDGWSLGIILKEFFQAYEILAKGGQPPPSFVKPGFKEFIRWHGEQDPEEQKKFWQNYLEGFDTLSRLPGKRLKPGPGLSEKSNYRLHFSQTVKNKLEVFVKDKRITLAAFFYCAWGVLLQKYCGMEDVVFGITVSGRSVPIRGIEDMVGLFINTIPLRAGFEPGEGLMDVLVRINNHLAAGEKYENTPLVDIYSYCRQLTRVREELFDTLVSMENYPLDTYLKETGPRISIQSYEMEEKPHYDLTVVISASGGIDIDFIYDNTSFDKETIVRLAHHLGTILKGMGENVEKSPHEIEILSGEEKQQLLVDFNRTSAAYLKQEAIHELFAGQVDRTPDNIALVGRKEEAGKPGSWEAKKKEDIFVTYKELNYKSEQLARLLGEKGVRSDTIVGIMVERSIEMVTRILGILKAGGAYLPIDPDYPRERINYMLKDSSASILLATENTEDTESDSYYPSTLLPFYSSTLPSSHPSTIPPFNPSNPSSLAYIIYTSGSTGKPKGVIVRHGSLINLLLAMHGRYPLGERDVYLLKTSYMFDVSVTELFGWFMEGGRLAVLESGDEKNPNKIIDAIEHYSVSHINFVPSMFNVFTSALEPGIMERLSGLKYIFLAGEALLPGTVTRFNQLNTTIALENIYGPTEATVYASWYSLSAWTGEGPIPIGKPLPNVSLYILNKWGNLQPVGIPGELCISGAGLACGYLNNPELTNKKLLRGVQGGGFLEKSPPGRRRPVIYKTGDLARWITDGNIEFLGRMDHQVKVRGFRIELGEIETHLLKYPRVSEAVVIEREDDKADKYLCAYTRVEEDEGGSIEPIVLRNYLSGLVPGYMIPSYFVQLDKIPLTPSGKLDRKALPVPGIEIGDNYIAPRDEIERRLAAIWSKVLKIETDRIGIDDNFFHLGGHSLKATTVVSLSHKELQVNVEIEDIFNHPSIRGLSRRVRELEAVVYTGVKAVEQREYYELSYAQRRLWVLCQFEEDSTAYNMPGAVVLDGVFHPGVLQEAVNTLVDHHESLRTVFIDVQGEPRQRTARHLNYTVESLDLRGMEEKQKIEKSRELFRKYANTAFDLEHGPLFCFKAVRCRDDQHILICNIHHIVNDGWSQELIYHQLVNIYNAILTGNPNPLVGLEVQYKDYSCWHNRLIEGGWFRKVGQYWLEKFRDKPNGIELPLDCRRKSIQTFNGDRVCFEIEPDLTSKLSRMGESCKATLFMSLLTLVSVFLYRYTGQCDIPVGAPIANRRQPELHGLVGFLVNTLVYRLGIQPERTFLEHLQAAKQEALDCYAHQDYPFDLLVEKLELERDLSQSPLFNVMLAHNNAQIEDSPLTMKGVEISSYPYSSDFNMSKFDLIFFMDERGQPPRIVTQLEYNSDLFHRGTIERMRDSLLCLLEETLEQPHVPIHQLNILSAREYEAVIHRFNASDHPFENLTLQEIFENQVEKSPDKCAVVSRENSDWDPEQGAMHITYRELNQKANQLAHFLREQYGIMPNHIIGVSMDRSVLMIVVLWGIIKAGGGYLADPTYPQERVLYVLADSQADLLIIDRFRPQLFGDYTGKILDIKTRWPEISRASGENPFLVNHPGDILYVNYTSGTTGTPNGAMLSHDCLTNLINWQNQNTTIDCSLKCLQFTSINFCVSFQEIMGTLTSGGQLYLIGDIERQDIDYLMDFLSRNRIEILFLPFSYLNFLFNQSDRWSRKFRHSLNHIVTAGEQLKITTGLKRFLEESPHLRLHNHYGSTEMHVVTSYTLGAEAAARVPIPPAGKPIGNIKIFILDEHLNPVPVGVWGELFVKGSSEVLGYINNEAMTDKKLFYHPVLSSRDNTRLYRSGDIGRWLPDGNIELRGRKDFMMKIRGFRIEPGEIESKILAIQQVCECVVVPREDEKGQKSLFAYVSVEDIEAGEIKRILNRDLPHYMIPQVIILDNLPLMPNGKVDRERLPAPEFSSGETRRIVPATNEVERKLVKIWSQLLEMEEKDICIHDNFFDLGGHSLKATNMISLIHEELEIKVKLVEVFKNPTIMEIATLIQSLLVTASPGRESGEEIEEMII
ncbi:MAG: amino acid adenylation domain-containing protein [Candidatus Aminicenantes bacterium]|jgi:amino acid adenylation domain-containing protein